MRIKIVKSSLETYWYNNLVGREFQVTRREFGKVFGCVHLTAKELKEVKKEFPKEEMENVSGLTIMDNDYKIVRISKLEK